jgi:choline kinase
VKAIILAAGLGRRLESVTGGLPKCMVPVGGVPLLDRMIERLAQVAVDQVIVVTGHRAGDLEAHLARSTHPLARGAVRVFNPRYAEWGNFYSLLVAKEAVGGDGFIKLDGDVLMDGRLLPQLLAAPGPAALAVDVRGGLGAEEMKVRVEGGRIVELNKRMDPARALGEFVGIERIDAELAPRVWAQLAQLIDRGETDEYYERAYELLMQDGIGFSVADVSEVTWCEIDDGDDLAAAEALLPRIG